MKPLLLALLLTIPTLSYSQAIPFEGRGPLVSFTAGAVNINHYNPINHNRTLWGWSATPEIRLTSRFGLQADVSNSYMKSVYPGEYRLFIAGGPRYNFPLIHRVQPFAFGEGGEIKTNAQGSSVKTWIPVATVGLGLEYVVSRHLALTLVPAEYLGEKEDDGTWTHSFAARAGFTFNFYR
jgi:hypothetical protein